MKLTFKGKDLSKNQARWLCENRFKEVLSVLDDYHNNGNPKTKHWSGERGVMMLSDFAGDRILTKFVGDFLDYEFSVGFDDFKSVGDFLNII